MTTSETHSLRDAERARARAETQERHAEVMREADELVRRASDASERTALAGNWARHAIKELRTAAKVREDTAHEGVDRTIDAARDRLRAALRSARADLSGGPLSTQHLAELVALWTATTQEGFADTLHELLEEPDAPGDVPMMRLTGGQVEARLQLARTHEGTIREAAERARACAATVAQQRTATDLSGRDDLDAARAAADAAEAAADAAEDALRDVRTALNPDRGSAETSRRRKR